MKKFLLVLSAVVLSGAHLCAMHEIGKGEQPLPRSEYQVQLSGLMQLAHLHHNDYLVGEVWTNAFKVRNSFYRSGENLSAVVQCLHELKEAPERARFDFADAVDVLTQVALAMRIGHSHPTIAQYESTEDLMCVEKNQFDAEVRAANIDVDTLTAHVALDFVNEIARAFSPTSPRTPKSPQLQQFPQSPR